MIALHQVYRPCTWVMRRNDVHDFIFGVVVRSNVDFEEDDAWYRVVWFLDVENARVVEDDVWHDELISVGRA